MIIDETYLIVLIGILLNGIITGFAVYIGSHTGARIIDRFKSKSENADMSLKPLVTENQKSDGSILEINESASKENYERLKKRWQKESQNKELEENIKPKGEID